MKLFLHFCILILSLQAEPLRLQLATFNIRYEGTQDAGWESWTNRVQRLVTTIRKMNPDCFGVQEALHGQMADLRLSLPDYESVGQGRDDAAKSGEYSAIFFRRETFQADYEDTGMFWLSDTPTIPGSKTWGNEIPRIVTWLHLKEIKSGRDFTLYNTHWDHKNQNSRERSAQLIMQKISNRKNKNVPFVLLGDFNSNEQNPAILSLTKFGLINTFNEKHGMPANRTTLHFWQNNKIGTLKVDHIFVPHGTRIADATIITPPEGKHPPSDHFPVTADITFP